MVHYSFHYNKGIRDGETGKTEEGNGTFTAKTTSVVVGM